MARKPNQAQGWYCAKCNTVTTHDTAGSQPSVESNIISAGKRGPMAKSDAIVFGYIRYRKCTGCGMPHKAAEVSLTELRKTLMSLDAAKAKLEKAQAAIASLEGALTALKSAINDGSH